MANHTLCSTAVDNALRHRIPAHARGPPHHGDRTRNSRQLAWLVHDGAHGMHTATVRVYVAHLAAHTGALLVLVLALVPEERDGRCRSGVATSTRRHVRQHCRNRLSMARACGRVCKHNHWPTLTVQYGHTGLELPVLGAVDATWQASDGAQRAIVSDLRAERWGGGAGGGCASGSASPPPELPNTRAAPRRRGWKTVQRTLDQWRVASSSGVAVQSTPAFRAAVVSALRASCPLRRRACRNTVSLFSMISKAQRMTMVWLRRLPGARSGRDQGDQAPGAGPSVQ